MYATRLRAVLVVLGLGMVLVLVSLLRLQVIQGGRYREEAAQRLRRPPGFRPTIRGTIFDRHGVALARDTGAFDVAVYLPFLEMTDGFVARMARKWGVAPEEAVDRLSHMWDELSRLTRVPPDELARRAEVIRQRVEIIRQSVREVHGRRILVREETYGDRTSVPHPIVYDVDLKAVGVISSRPDEFPGLILQPTRKREYPHGNVAPHVIGRLGEVTAEDLAGADGAPSVNTPYPPGDLRRYWPGDWTGRGGVESAREDLLRGSRGMYQKGIDGNFLEDIEAVAGRDVHLTLDIALQGDVEDILDRADARRLRGAAVVLDCRTGEVLVLASAPRYDVREFSADFPDLAASTGRPLVHRAISGLYPMGSTFKAVTATAALHTGTITPRSFLECNGILDPDHPTRFRCHVYPAGHGAIPLRVGVQKSCNVFFYHLGEMIGRDRSGKIDLRLGSARLQEWAHRLGLGQPTGIGLPGESGGRVDVRDPRNLAVGQGELLVTPLQAAQLYGLVATSGRMPPLRLIREASPPPDAVRPGLDLDPTLMGALCDALDAVVNEPGGTGYGRADLPDIRIAGKTGTAQAGSGGDHAWFDGFAPVEAPRIAFAVIVEHGGHGGETAGPIAREIVKACQAYGYLGDGAPAPGPRKGPRKPAAETPAAGAPAEAVPDTPPPEPPAPPKPRVPVG